MRNIDETNVDQYIENLINRTNGKYITQGVSFNKNCKRQMKLLRQALLESSSFSGLIKEMLALNFHQEKTRTVPAPSLNVVENREKEPDPPEIEQKTPFQPTQDQVKQNVSGWV